MLHDADLVRVTNAWGSRSLLTAIEWPSLVLSHVHRSLSGHYAPAVPNVVGITLKITEQRNLQAKKVADAQFPDWMRPAFIKRRNLAGEWESIEPKPDQLLLENDRMVLFV